jgi:signal transduction histidine kinase
VTNTNAWLRPLRATAFAIGLMLATTWVAVRIGALVEGHTRHSVAMFAELESNLFYITLVIAPILFVALRLNLLGRIHRLRLKLFAALVVGQTAAFVAAVVAAKNKLAMPFDPPIDGLFAVLLVYASVLSLALFYLLANSLASSLGAIRAGAARIAEGDLETCVAVDTRDELADLAADLNLMAGRLADVARQERRMEQSRRELIAAVSHDLRTPLAAIRATIEAILDGVVTDEETVTRYLRTMRDGTKELSRLIDDLFELSRIEAGALALTPAPTSLEDLLSETLERMTPQATARGVALDGRAAPGLPMLPLDARQIGRVLVNLVDNALRHTPEGGQVRVEACRADGAVRVEVTDSGAGIAPADLPRVFERFYRGDKSRSREHGGAGLGLAISKGIVEAHGGVIWAEPAIPHGARVAFTLPLTRDAARP